MIDLLEPRSPAFIGLWESIAWIGTRDRKVADEVRESVTSWHDDHGVSHGGMAINLFERFALDLRAVFALIADLCASEELIAKGQGSDGFQTVPADYWLGTKFTGLGGPDAIVGAHAAPWEAQTSWKLVRFKRSDIERLFPPLAETTTPTFSADSFALNEAPAASAQNREPKPRAESAKEKGLLAYHRYYRSSQFEQTYEGNDLFDRYTQWANKNNRPVYGRSQFYHVWRKVRCAEPE